MAAAGSVSKLYVGSSKVEIIHLLECCQREIYATSPVAVSAYAGRDIQSARVVDASIHRVVCWKPEWFREMPLPTNPAEARACRVLEICAFISGLLLSETERGDKVPGGYRCSGYYVSEVGYPRYRTEWKDPREFHETVAKTFDRVAMYLAAANVARDPSTYGRSKGAAKKAAAPVVPVSVEA